VFLNVSGATRVSWRARAGLMLLLKSGGGVSREDDETGAETDRRGGELLSATSMLPSFPTPHQKKTKLSEGILRYSAFRPISVLEHTIRCMRGHDCACHADVQTCIARNYLKKLTFELSSFFFELQWCLYGVGVMDVSKLKFPNVADPKKHVFSLEEIKKNHSTRESCYLVANGRVHDVTLW
jgi:hypothetical protein